MGMVCCCTPVSQVRFVGNQEKGTNILAAEHRVVVSQCALSDR